MNYTIAKGLLPEFLLSLKKEFKVLAPALNPTGAVSFQLFEGQQLVLGKKPDFSPKLFFRPAKEKIFSFEKKGSAVETKEAFDETKKLIFGIRPCDTHALHALDELFIRYFGDDQFYTRHRKNAVLVALQCNESCENGFCTSLGTSQPIGHDLLFIERGNDFFVKPITEKGKKLLGSGLFKPCKDAEPSSKIECKKQLETKNLGENLYANFNHPIWKQEAERCLSCSSCTQICPTCYCYFTDDEFVFGSDSESGRSRFLDSCQLQRFTRVAGNHVFRQSRAARLRQFVLHHLHYYQHSHGLQLCIGCGRCIDVCPVKIDLVKIANTIQKDAVKK